ncbi:uncharacterized protein LOC132621661 [Lycium barbarum]|uniref:uncharacterized protein LOC132621661 n=1 Tax=Lycium barbarum TaxID=112863 RepID=UPI00293F2E7B|nr:uncharacterized protein LOC132621661 [Lycium barbarum]
MSESFNAWILSARHKTIVSMLEEIRIKVMNRIAKMRAFSETWVDGISPMALKVFNANVEKSMNCTLHWNGDCGFEIKEGLGTHIVQLAREYCSCRSWQLKGIPCAHAIAAMHYRRIDPSENIVHWYRQETYLRAYSHFIQPVPSMIMWPDSTNPKIEPPEVKKMPGRPRRCRRKEIGEVRRAGKLTKRGIAMTCPGCKSSTHNIRSCPSRPPIASATTFAPSRRKYSVPPTSSATSKSKYSRPPTVDATSKRKYSWPPKAAGSTRAANAGETAPPTTPATAPPTAPATAPPTAPPTSKRKYTKPPVPPSPKATTKANASQQSSTGSTRKSSVHDTQDASTSMRGGRTKYKRPRVVGQGVFVSESGYKCVNQGMPSSRLVSTPKAMNSALVTGDIGYKPSKGLKWKGTKAVTQRQLQVQSANHRIQTRSKALGVQTRSRKGKSPMK